MAEIGEINEEYIGNIEMVALFSPNNLFRVDVQVNFKNCFHRNIREKSFFGEIHMTNSNIWYI